MPLPRTFAHFNREVTNHLFMPLGERVPPWVILEHTGRRSGRTYRTVLMAFRHGDDLVIALTYGTSADWLRNALASATCRVKRAGRWGRYAPSLLPASRGVRLLPLPVRAVLSLGRIHDVAYLRPQ